ncbi:MAG: DNA repair protein RecN [Thermovirgaceae bacterium]
MLEELHVKNIGGIQQADLRLHGSFIAITGESGAGKSSLIRALELASGKRAQASLIRAGNDEAEVHAVLAPGSDTGDLPEELRPQEGVLLIRRILSRTGRTKTYIQDRPVSLNLLQNMMNPYIGIQSQFAQLDLLDPRRQLNLLDARGGQAVTSLREKLQEKVSAALKKEREYGALVKRRQEIEERYEGAEEILSRIRSLHLDEESEKRWEETLCETQQKISRSGKILAIYDELTGGCAGEGLRSRLEMIIYELKNLLDPEAKENLVELTESFVNGLRSIEDLCEKHLESEEPQKLQESFTSLERRLGILRKLKRTTRSETASDLAEYERQATKELQWLKNSRERLSSLQQECAALRKEVSRLALDLRKARKDAAGSLEKAVNAVLGDLGMETYSFGVDMLPGEKVRYHGADDVDFFLSDGASLKGSVAKVASGGELSRLLLALQCASPREMLPPVLVFDEVEAGLGGKAAMLSGYKLRELSEDCQVILVTHEASIAALADQHFKVERTRDVTSVVEISGEHRVVEIARMLAGDHEAPEALMHARSLVAATGK